MSASPTTLPKDICGKVFCRKLMRRSDPGSVGSPRLSTRGWKRGPVEVDGCTKALPQLEFAWVLDQKTSEGFGVSPMSL